METRHPFISARIFADNRHNCQVAEYKDVGPGRRDTEHGIDKKSCKPRMMELLGLRDERP